MCGIAGMFNLKESLENRTSIFEAMQSTLRRRGPDQNGLHIEGSVALVHTRLSVVDPENGRQPMFFTRGNEHYAIIYNGELYNTAELRSELENLGHRFMSHSDTEVLLHCYVEWKEKCVDRLNGIFAFVVWEKHEQRMFAARDRIGVKPFFYALRNGAFLFASELKALLVHPDIRSEIDENSIAEIMFIGPGRTPGCGVFKDIKEFPPAVCGFFSSKGLRLWQYWKLEDREHTDSFSQTMEKVRWLVTDSIQRQLVSDVPIGTFLSGGLDSSIISSVADKFFSKKEVKLHTFSVGYKDNERYFKSGKFQPDSDDAFIDRMNQYLGAEHHRILLDSEDLARSLYAAVDARDLPGMADVDSSLLLFCKEIKNHVTVALSGECADEIFGGYPWYRDKEIREKDGFPWAQSTSYRAGFLTPEFREKVDALSYVETRYRKTISETSVLPDKDSGERRMLEMINLNLKWFMQTLLDRNDMKVNTLIESNIYRIVCYMNFFYKQFCYSLTLC